MLALLGYFAAVLKADQVAICEQYYNKDPTTWRPDLL